MRITLDLRKSVEQNAAVYFEKSKKAKRKLEGIGLAIARFRDQEARLLADKEFALEEEKKRQQKVKRKKEWYEKFRWFISSEGVLCLGGRDATTNEVLVKKHTEKDDVVFHTDAPGSPFFVIKCEGKKPGQATMDEVAQATASFSKAWKVGVASTEVYWVLPEQVSKQAKSGEYLGKGAFMIYGKRNYARPMLALAVGVLADGRVMCGPPAAVKKQCAKVVLISQGDEKASAAAKKVAKKLGVDDLDAVIACFPAGGVRV